MCIRDRPNPCDGYKNVDDGQYAGYYSGPECKGTVGLILDVILGIKAVLILILSI